MLKIISLNLNKRLGNPNIRQAVERWLIKQDVDVFIVQEPWVINKDKIYPINNYLDLGGTDLVRVWIKKSYKPSSIKIIADNWLELKLDYITVENIYLSAYDSDLRIEQLSKLQNYINGFSDTPFIVVGDFNLAPTLEDGLIDDHPSTFNKEEERIQFSNLLNSCHLVDIMALTTNKSEREFTIERKISTSIYQFRCDLALVTRYISNLIYAEYDHLVRSGNSRFTDHSAIILEMPVTFYPVNIHTPELFPEYNSESRNPVVVSSHKTAMGRVIPSSVAKKIVQSKLFNPSKIKILDYGCGRGMDLIYYKSMGYEADGWDPYEPFGYSIRPKTKYDLVICTFVLNVLYNRYERLKVIKEACSYLQPNGVLIIATRSPETIEHEALTKHWKPYNDGYWSSVSRRTFQRGISLKEIKIICEHLGYFIHPFTKILNCVSDTVVAVVSPFES